MIPDDTVYVPPDPNELTAHKAVAFAPGGTQPPNVTPQQLDNPPRVRVASAQVSQSLPNAVPPSDEMPLRYVLVEETPALPPALVSPPAAPGVRPIPLYVTTRPKDS